jgi:hypothetical protein
MERAVKPRDIQRLSADHNFDPALLSFYLARRQAAFVRLKTSRV